MADLANVDTLSDLSNLPTYAELGEPAEAAYPPAPWQMRGRSWAGVFTASQSARLPGDLKPLGSARWRALALVCYREGTLSYNELVYGTPARHGLRAGLYVEGIWVDSVPSLWGGRRIWGLHKRLARFVWDGDSCQISDAQGPIVTMMVNGRPSRLPMLPAILAGIGRLGDQWTFLCAPMWARLGVAGMRVSEWSPRFLETAGALGERPWLAVRAAPMRVRFPAPTLALITSW